MVRIKSTLLIAVFLSATGNLIVFLITRHAYAPVATLSVTSTLRPSQTASRITTIAPIMSEDLLQMDIPSYLSNYKNPCWYENNSTLKCLPYFQVLGNDKCGTTDLYDRLLHHPQILKNKGTLGKETYWWAWVRYGHFFQKEMPRVGYLKYYINYFSEAAVKIEKTVSSGTNYHPLVVGDGSPMTFWDLAGWSRIPQNMHASKPKKTTADVIKHLLPNCKLIVMFRNPTDRTYTDYHFLGGMKGYSTTAELFHRRVQESIDMFEECARVNGAPHCAMNWTLTDRLPVRIHISMYSIQLDVWLKTYKRKELFIIRTEDYGSDIKGTLQGLTQFLHIENYPDDLLDIVSNRSRKHETKQKRIQDPILEESKRLLDNYYATYNVKLAQRLNDDRFLWND